MRRWLAAHSNGILGRDLILVPEKKKKKKRI
jgi:hypothetical protein